MEFTASQIAAIAQGTVEGDGDVTVSTFAKIEEGHPGAISFLANPKYQHFIYTTRSSIVLVSRDFVPERPIAATLIRVDDPYATVARLLTMVQQMMNPPKKGIEQPAFIHPTATVPDTAYVGAFAYIGAGAVIGEGAQIYPQAYVGDNVRIGDRTILYPGVKIYHSCAIGADCIIHSGAVIGADGFGFAPTPAGYEKIPQTGNVVIEDNVEIGANTTIDRAMMGSTLISRGVKLDNLIQIAHNCRIGVDTVMAAQAGVAGSTKVGAKVMLGGQVGLAGHISVGDGAQLAAQSGVHKDVPAGARLFGTPAMDLTAYGKQSIYVKRLPKLEERLAALEKQIKKPTKQQEKTANGNK